MHHSASTTDPACTRCHSGRRRVVILGSTGSIGTNTLDVIRNHPDHFEVIGLTAHSNADLLLEQAVEFRPRWAMLTAKPDRQIDRKSPANCELILDAERIPELVAAKEVDVVVSAIVGSAGLLGTWAALEAGKTVALANKETMVVAGQLVQDLLKRRGGRIIPVDSEHSAIFQALADQPISAVDRVVLTGSGGPFRGKTREQLGSVTIESALAHPTWRMGRKITIDSATLMNKALEIIEARWLFDLHPSQIDVIIHPESIVHSFVEFVDGSILAQLSPPDMRLPIQYALLYPERLPGPTRRLNWHEFRVLNFQQADRETFPALELGFEVASMGGTSGAVLNAANEVAVAAFLAGDLPFLDISLVCRNVLAQHEFLCSPTLTELMAADRWARQEVSRWIRLQPLSLTTH